MGRKVRADAKLERLDDAQREQLHFWFAEGLMYHEVVKLLHQHFGLSVGKSAVSVYWRRHIMPQQQRDDAEIVAELAALPAGDFDAATLQRVRMLAWDALAQSHPNIDRAAKLLDMVWKAERHALALERLALEERRVALKERLAGLAGEPQAASAKGKKGGRAVKRGAVAAMPVPGESGGAMNVSGEQNSPRCAGYSGAVQTNAAESSSGGGSSEGVGGGGGAEVAAKALSCEGLSKGSEGAEVASVPVVTAELAPVTVALPIAMWPQVDAISLAESVRLKAEFIEQRIRAIQEAQKE